MQEKNKILIIFLVIMVVIVLGLVGYIVWDKVLRDVGGRRTTSFYNRANTDN